METSDCMCLTGVRGVRVRVQEYRKKEKCRGIEPFYGPWVGKKTTLLAVACILPPQWTLSHIRSKCALTCKTSIDAVPLRAAGMSSQLEKGLCRCCQLRLFFNVR